MNRAMDGDAVAVWLEKTKFWKPLPQNSAKQSNTDGGHDKQVYSNSQAIETRIVDEK